MTHHHNTRKHFVLLVATTVAAGVFATGCSTSSPLTLSSQDATPVSEVVVTDAPTTTTVVPTSTEAAPSAEAAPPAAAPAAAPVPAPAPVDDSAPAPAAEPAPTPTLAMPPVSLFPVITISPVVIPVILFPTVNTMSVDTSHTCLQAALAGFTTPVSWTTTNASSVTVSVNGAVIGEGLAAAGSIEVPIGCGQNSTVVVSARWNDGAAGGSKTAVIHVDSW